MAPAARRQRFWSLQARAAPYLLVSPFVLLFCVFLLYPMARSLYLSLHRTAGTSAVEFIALGHYRYILTDNLFWLACLNTVVFATLLTLNGPVEAAPHSDGTDAFASANYVVAANRAKPLAERGDAQGQPGAESGPGTAAEAVLARRARAAEWEGDDMPAIKVPPWPNRAFRAISKPL